MILFVFIINFPGFILNPLNQFIDGVHEIGQKNYDARLKFKTGDKFAALAIEFNQMAANLSELENKSLAKIISEENQVKILMKEKQAAVIGLNEKQEVLFINREARRILKLDDKPINGQRIRDVAKSSGILNTLLDSEADGRNIRLSLDGKASKYQIKQFEIVVPNLKPKPLDTLQFAGYNAGMVYVLKSIEQAEPDAVI